MKMLDSLTETGNRRYIEMNLGYRLDEMKRYGFPVGILFCILDDIESIDDTYGTVVKDKVIKMIGKTISKNIRFFEFVGRWEEDSFLVILSNVDIHKLDLIANKLRLLAEKSSIQVKDKFIHTTISVGGVMAESASTIESLVEKAENLAQLSQKKGKNKVTLSSEEY
jgi:diguanylate cyclase (GGDEF)-like protein